MKVKSIAECTPWMLPTGAFCNTFGLHLAMIGLETIFLSFLECPFYTGFTVQISDFQSVYVDNSKHIQNTSQKSSEIV